MNYRFRHFARKSPELKTDAAGVIVPGLNISFMSPVIAGIESVVNGEGYNLLISQSSENVKKR